MNCENKIRYVVGFCQIPAGNVAVMNSLIFYQNSKTLCPLRQQGEKELLYYVG